MSAFLQHDPKHPQHGWVGTLLVLLASVAVSSKAIIVKLAYVYPIDAASLIALRMVFALPFFAGLAWWASHRATTPLRRKEWAGILMLGIAGGYGPMWLDFAGLAYVTAGLERIILFLYPTMVVLMSAALFGQPVGRRAMFSLLASYAGVGLVVGHDVLLLKSDTGSTLWGATMVLASAIVYAAYLVISGRMIPQVGSARFTAYTMLAATLGSAVHFLLSHPASTLLGQPSAVYGLSLLMAVVATVLPAVMLNAGIRRIGSSQASLVSSIGPVSTILLAYVFLGEEITALQLIGTALVLVGVLAISLRPRQAVAA